MLKKTKSRSVKSLITISVLGLVCLVLLFVILEATNTIHFFKHPTHPEHTLSEYNKGEPKGSTKSPSNSSTTINNKEGGQASATLIMPTGDFVSSHHPSDNDSQETSTCNTTPGAHCTIVFTRGGLTKSLPTKTVDSGGAAYWAWTPNQLGLTAGSWTVKAVASLNGQTKTATDALTLEIQ